MSRFQYLIAAILATPILIGACTGAPLESGTDGPASPKPSGPTQTAAPRSVVSSPTPSLSLALSADSPATPTASGGKAAGAPPDSAPSHPDSIGATPSVAGPALGLPAVDFLADAPERDLYQLAAELKPDLPQNLPRVVNATPFSFDVGRKDTFWLMDLPSLKVYQSEFELRLITPHAYWYVEEGQVIRQRDLERSATIFEEDIYPRVTGAFGKEWSPGVDNDFHLNILNAGLRGTGGYFTSNDEYPRGVTPFSNQREVLYINTSAFPIANSSYLRTLAHELQHAIHWNGDPSEETWINEGLAELAATVAGYSPDSIHRFLQSGPTSLVHWPLSPSQAGANYGAASLFMHYLSDHYGTPNGLRALVEEPADGIAGIDAYLEGLGYEVTFRDVFRDWVVANLLDQPQGIYGYSDLEVRARVRSFISQFSEFSSAAS